MGLASVGKPLSPLDPEKQKEGALSRTVAIALEERFQLLPPGRERARNTGLSVVFLPPPSPLPWLPLAEPSTQQGSASPDIETG